MDGKSYAECRIPQYQNFSELFPGNKECGNERKENRRENDEKRKEREGNRK
jgi:hypothetical protein